MKRFKRSLFAMSLMIGTAWAITPAFAQVIDQTAPMNIGVMDRAHSDYDAIGIHAGGFMIYPTTTVSVESNSNVKASQLNKKSDLIFTVAPYVSAQSNWSRHALRLSAGVTDVNYGSLSGDDHLDGQASADARIDVYHESSVSFGGAYVAAHEARTAGQPTALASKLVPYTDGSVYVLGQTTIDRFRLSARGDYAHFQYDNIPGFNNHYRDYDLTSGTLRAEYALTPDTAIVAQGSDNQYHYPKSNLGSTGQEYLVGVTSKLTRLVRGEVDVGYTTQKYVNAAVGTVQGPAVRANVQWYPTQRTTVTVLGSREVAATGIIGTGALNSTEGVHVDHELLRNVILSGGVGASQTDYSGISRHDQYYDVNVGATYLMNRHVGLNLYYDYGNFKSGQVGQNNYDINRIVLSLTLKL